MRPQISYTLLINLHVNIIVVVIAVNDVQDVIHFHPLDARLMNHYFYYCSLALVIARN